MMPSGHNGHAGDKIRFHTNASRYHRTVPESTSGHTKRGFPGHIWSSPTRNLIKEPEKGGLGTTSESTGDRNPATLPSSPPVPEPNLKPKLRAEIAQMSTWHTLPRFISS